MKGNKCHICTGCGRCFLPPETADGQILQNAQKPNQNALHILTTDGGEGLSHAFLGEAARPFFVGADIGTTTLAMELYDEKGSVLERHVSLNPQYVYGADVLSRIQAAQDSRKARHMRELIADEIGAGVRKFREAYPEFGEDVFLILAGNTTMVYLLAGDDPAELGRAPFAASKLGARHTRIAGLESFVFPGLSAFVGGDIVAGMYACGMLEAKGQGLILLIDLGTNGEMVLGDAQQKIACATAAGPAFEGGVNRGVWGSDMVHLLAELKRTGVMDNTGLLADPYFEEGVRIGDVLVTQQSVRAIQLAKAAVRAGIRILMREYGIEEEPDKITRVILSGGFGYYIDPADAACIGLLPEELTDRCEAGGNTALLGARKMGLALTRDRAVSTIPGKEEESDAGAAQLQRLESRLRPAEGAEVINLAAHPDFETLYIGYMDF